MEDVKEVAYKRYQQWLESVTDDFKEELLRLKDNEEEIIDRFYKDLEFGTGGLRGIMGVGTNRMNVYTVARATQGFANYLKKYKDFPSVVIAYDTRLNSDLFAKVAARVLAANNVNVHIFDQVAPTPLLSFTVRKLKADGGIIITASHNPPQYNGYKVYTSDGTQAVPQYANEITSEIEKLDYFKDIKMMGFEEAVNSEKINILSESIFNDYLDEIEGYIRSLNPKMDKKPLIVYTPLYGAALKLVEGILNRLGFEFSLVEEQSKIDPSFSTLKVPNPEEKEAFELALKKAKEIDADLILATDPDGDRIGVFEKYKGDYVSFTGNQIGVMLAHYLLSKFREFSSLKPDDYIVKTIVTTDMVKPIAQEFDVKVEETLTGFKYIGEKIEKYLGSGKKFIFGFEESYGYLANDHVRDKDAIIAAALISVMSSESLSKLKTLTEYLKDLKERYGYYDEKLLSFTFEGFEGTQKIKRIMSKMRKNPPIKVGDFPLKETLDYLNGIEGFPKSDVVELRYSNVKIIARPSGTEPKIKFYIMVKSSSENESRKLIKDAEQAISEIVNV
ncbi:phosphoglucomutase [Petrotoga sp. HWH.PT.55.6.1]|uniref:phospho-sugar mutase n=1 Tax=unclassified Petrotoga TaxID=2620614 RepID=UPI000CA00C38|nr:MULTISPECIES: phospho-sugar mutase [unclassified Petrotoga]PNR92287.1 phosphoglucomutase [Petrotoga sp. HWHPT.55.6.3]RLL86372.1 phosphoglucomutase [Petrotoga sp. Shatin.DS.tank11.9.2.9.3]RLL88042.1 phosphoglucomutase [Petrotoga sp. HKA.pet.4.5]RPD35116.1 phosphoglucomutase [Petrotoga sp. HWH.PT.55.6.1]